MELELELELEDDDDDDRVDDEDDVDDEDEDVVVLFSDEEKVEDITPGLVRGECGKWSALLTRRRGRVES